MPQNTQSQHLILTSTPGSLTNLMHCNFGLRLLSQRGLNSAGTPTATSLPNSSKLDPGILGLEVWALLGFRV